MEINDYQKFTNKTFLHQEDADKEIMMLGLGIAGEAGDVAGCIKKTCAHKDDQILGIKENLGDTMWYLAAICEHYGWTMTEVLEENMGKLNKRYAKGVTHKAAAKRKRIDWNESKKK